MKIKAFLILSFLLFNLSVFSQTDQQKAAEYFKNAQLFINAGDYENALLNLEESAKLYKKIGDLKNYVIPQLTASELLLNLGQMKEGDDKLKLLLPDAITAYTEKSVYVAYIYSLQGRILFMYSDFENAKIKFSKAYQINVELKGAESIEAARGLNDLALVMVQLQNIDSALIYYKENIRIITKIEGENSMLLPSTYFNLANLYLSLGYYDESIDLNLKSVNILNSTGNETSDEMAKSYSSLGNAYMIKGEFNLSKEYFTKSNEIYTVLYGDKNYNLAENYINLGNLNNKQGEFEYALQYYFVATKILEENFPNSPDFAALYNNIGLIFKNMAKYPNAKTYFQKALDRKDATNTYNDEQTAAILSNLGTVYLLTQDTINAINSFNKSVSILIGSYGIHNPTVVNPLMNIANFYFDNGQVDSAKLYFYKAINSNQRSANIVYESTNIPINDYFDGIQLLEAINGIARIELYEYVTDSNFVHLSNASKKLSLCDSLITVLRTSYFNDEDKIRLNAQISKVFDNAVEITFLMYYKSPSDRPKYEKSLFYFIERNKTSSLLEAINSSNVEKFGDVPDSLIALENKYKEQINIYSQKLSTSQDANEKFFYRDKIITENQNYSKLLNIYKTSYPQYYNAKFSATTTSIDQIRQIIDDSTGVLNYYITSQNIFVFLLTKTKNYVYSAYLDTNLYKFIPIFNNSLLSNQPNDIKNYVKYGYLIYNQLFFFKMPANIKKLVIIPDDVLSTLSFEALLTSDFSKETPDFQKMPYLIKKYQIIYSYSSSMMYETSKINYDKYSRNDIFCAAPVFKTDNQQVYQGVTVSTILGSEQEVNDIIKLFSDNAFTFSLLTNNDANEYKIKKFLTSNQFKIIHIATHGIVNLEKPELSALVLSDDPSNVDDGILFSGEIYNLKLRADLITLSACETAKGKFSKGEGVIGLSRAFFYAGAKNMIISLWKVSDIATTELMTKFYGHLLTQYPTFQNVKFSDALYKAKLDMINSRFSHPYFWSAFVLVGN